MMGSCIVGIENIGGDLEKVASKRFKLNTFPLRWFKGNGFMARVIAGIDEDQINDVPERVYPFGDR
jgi:kynurenine formamidase